MKNTNYSLIMLVIASRGDIYDQMVNCYWVRLIKNIKKHNYPIKIFMLFGNDKVDDLSLSTEDVLFFNDNILVKTLDAFEYINTNYEYKHILRTNLSSFFILEELIKVSNRLDDNNVYDGLIYFYYNYVDAYHDFVSGAGFWLSTDNINYILSNKENIEYNLPDDVAIGKLMKDKKSSRLKNKYIISNIDEPDKHKLLTDLIESGEYHIRIKNEADRTLDIIYMKAFTDILYISIL